MVALLTQGKLETVSEAPLKAPLAGKGGWRTFLLEGGANATDTSHAWQLGDAYLRAR